MCKGSGQIGTPDILDNNFSSLLTIDGIIIENDMLIEENNIPEFSSTYHIFIVNDESDI